MSYQQFNPPVSPSTGAVGSQKTASSHFALERAKLRAPGTLSSVFGLIVSMMLLAGLCFSLGLLWSQKGHAAPNASLSSRKSSNVGTQKNDLSANRKSPRIIYPKETKIDFEGLAIEGEIRNPGEFYFQHKVEEKFDSLVQRRKNFHREMLRDVVMSK